MKEKPKTLQNGFKKLPETQQVFSKDGNVFLKKTFAEEAEEWSAINFYWQPVIALRRELG